MAARYGTVSLLHVLIVVLVVAYVAAVSFTAIQATRSLDSGSFSGIGHGIQQVHVSGLGTDVELGASLRANLSRVRWRHGGWMERFALP
ncbi:MAG: hypothetical protein SVU32_01490 [Candidatus Nanohaloarchaea archaeon]|nr:hypothetical protein [Candidatus Nanohaloarchaea archaeon]